MFGRNLLVASCRKNLKKKRALIVSCRKGKPVGGGMVTRHMQNVLNIDINWSMIKNTKTRRPSSLRQRKHHYLQRVANKNKKMNIPCMPMPQSIFLASARPTWPNFWRFSIFCVSTKDCCMAGLHRHWVDMPMTLIPIARRGQCTPSILKKCMNQVWKREPGSANSPNHVVNSQGGSLDLGMDKWIYSWGLRNADAERPSQIRQEQ